VPEPILWNSRDINFLHVVNFFYLAKFILYIFPKMLIDI